MAMEGARYDTVAFCKSAIRQKADEVRAGVILALYEAFLRVEGVFVGHRLKKSSSQPVYLLSRGD